MKRLPLLFAAFCAVHSNAAGASGLQLDADSAMNADVSLPNLEVVSRKEKESVVSTVPFHLIDSRAIRQSGITDIADAVKRLPGINLRDYGGAGGLKTVSVRGLGAQHTGVAYDGIPLSDLRSGEIDLSRYSLNNVSALSLVAGDHDDIFAPARNASTANLITISSLQPPALWEKAFDANLRMKFGSFGFYNPFLRAGWSNGSDFACSAVAEFTHAKNDFPFTLRNGDLVTRERRSDSQMNSLHSELNIIYAPKPASSLAAKIYYYDNSRHLPGPVIYYAAPSDERLHDRDFFSQLRWRSKLSSVFSIMGFGKFNWSASQYQDTGGIYPGGKLDQKYYQREAYASVALLALPTSWLSLDYSGDWFFNNLTSNLVTDSHPFRHSILQSVTAKAVVGPLTAMARLLYSIYLDRAQGRDDLNNSRLSPSVSLSMRPFRDISLFFRASYKNIFRMPTFNELYFDNYGTANLLPETTDQWNVGVTFSAPSSPLLKDLTVTFDGYANYISNRIVAIPYNLFKWTLTNLGKVRTFGMDATVNAEFGIASNQSLVTALSYSYQRAQPRTSPDMSDWMKQVAYTPLNSGSCSLSWLNPWASVAIHATGTSARYTTNSNLPSTRIPGYADFGLAVFHTFTLSRHSLELRADIINLLDKQFEIVARYPMPGRSWAFSLDYSF